MLWSTFIAQCDHKALQVLVFCSNILAMCASHRSFVKQQVLALLKIYSVDLKLQNLAILELKWTR